MLDKVHSGARQKANEPRFVKVQVVLQCQEGIGLETATATINGKRFEGASNPMSGSGMKQGREAVQDVNP